MPFAAIPTAEPTTRRDKRLLIVIGAVILAALIGVGIWAAVRPGAYGASKNGCITVNIPSSMGGTVEHACGAQARTTCQQAYVKTDPVSLLTRPQCRAAGIKPAPTTSSAG